MTSDDNVINLDLLKEKYLKLDSNTRKLIRSLLISTISRLMKLEDLQKAIRKNHLSNFVNNLKDVGVIKIKGDIRFSEIKIVNNKIYFVTEEGKEREYKIKYLYQLYVVGSYLKNDLKTPRTIRFPKGSIVFED